MIFKSLTNYRTCFRQVRKNNILMVCCCTLISLTAVTSAFVFAERQRQKIYLLAGGKSLLCAISDDAQKNRAAEARSHVARFHELFFTLSPDKKAIEEGIARALLLADKTAFECYTDQMEKGYYNRVIAAGIHQRISVDSISGNFDTYPYEMKTYGRIFIRRESNLTERNLITRCFLTDTGRTDDNPHGFEMSRFEILENRDIGSQDR